MIANETSGTGFRGVAEYVTFEKNKSASNESFFELREPVNGTYGQPFNLRGITDNKPRFDGLAASRTTQPGNSLSSLPGRRLVPLKEQPHMLLQGDARADLEHGEPDAFDGLRRPSLGRAGGAKQRLGDKEIRGEYVGGTLTGTPREMARQAASFRAARPDAKAPVMHYSLALEAGDGRKTAKEWEAMAQKFLEKMGFDHKRGAWACWVHRDTENDHAHIVYLRSMGDGTLWNREFSARRAIAATAEIEREFGLLTHDRTPKREKRRLTRNEVELNQKLAKKGLTMTKAEMQKNIDGAVFQLSKDHPDGFSLEQFRTVLKDGGLQVEAYSPKDKLTGLKYQKDGMWVSGSSLGSDYSPKGLMARGLLVAQQASEGHADAQAEGKKDDAVQAHNRRAAGLGDVFGKALAVSIDALKALIRMIIDLVNRLLGSHESTAGAPSGSLGRFDNATGKFSPGPKASWAASAAVESAAMAVAGGLAAVEEKAVDQQWSELIDHGPAPYKNEHGASQSYFARLRLPDGQETDLWGVDIERALVDAGVNTGDQLTLRRAGQQTVTIKERNADGNVIGEREVKRNAWLAEKPEEKPEDEATAAPVVSAAAPRTTPEQLFGRAALRDSTIFYLRDKATYLTHQHGADSKEAKAVMAQLQKLGYGALDEEKYQAWAKTPAAQMEEGEDDAGYMARREIEHLEERIHLDQKCQLGMSQEEQGRTMERLKALHLERFQRAQLGERE